MKSPSWSTRAITLSFLITVTRPIFAEYRFGIICNHTLDNANSAGRSLHFAHHISVSCPHDKLPYQRLPVRSNQNEIEYISVARYRAAIDHQHDVRIIAEILYDILGFIVVGTVEQAAEYWSRWHLDISRETSW